MNIKFLKNLFFLLVMVSSLFAIQACSDDDDNSIKSRLVGAWKIGEGCNAEIYEFKSDGTFKEYYFDKVETGRYSINDGLETLMLSYSSGSTYTYFLTTLTDSYFVITSMKTMNSSTYNRCDVSPNGDYFPLTTQIINGHEAVDLGLSVKWATCNVGATSWQEVGNYYAWGETSTKTSYTESNYKWNKKYYDEWYYLTKYCTDSDYGTVDNKTTLDSSDDVARVKWGGKWRMPTKEEFEELLDNCTRKQGTRNGVSGYYYYANNNNYIFLPGGGVMTESGNPGYLYYWTSTLDEDRNNKAYSQDGGNNVRTEIRYYGLPVRPVCK